MTTGDSNSDINDISTNDVSSMVYGASQGVAFVWMGLLRLLVPCSSYPYCCSWLLRWWMLPFAGTFPEGIE